MLDPAELEGGGLALGARAVAGQPFNGLIG